MVLCIFLSIVTCLSAIIKTAFSGAPNSVRMRFLRKATCFPLVSVLSYAMLIMVYIDHTLYLKPSWFFPVAGVLELSNPLMNTISYFLGCSFAGSPNRTRVGSRRRNKFSFCVDFTSAQIVDLTDLVDEVGTPTELGPFYLAPP